MIIRVMWFRDTNATGYFKFNANSSGIRFSLVYLECLEVCGFILFYIQWPNLGRNVQYFHVVSDVGGLAWQRS